MQKKPTAHTATRSSKTQVATTTASETSRAEVAQALAKGSGNLAPAEEKALRMRLGVGAPRTLVLERVGQENPQSREKLLGIELELLRQWRQRQVASQRPEAVARAAVESPANPRRSRIVAALKKKSGK